jgi:hypothetical protein
MLLVLLFGLPVCGGGESSEAGTPAPGSGGLTLEVSFSPEPLRAGQPVTWSLQVTNDGPDSVTLTFRTGQDGEAVLRRGGTEVYRWSAQRFFSQALRRERLDAGQHKTFKLEDDALRADPGDYELEAALAAESYRPAGTESGEGAGDHQGEGDDERPLKALDEEAGPSEDEGEDEKTPREVESLPAQKGQ